MDHGYTAAATEETASSASGRSCNQNGCITTYWILSRSALLVTGTSLRTDLLHPWIGHPENELLLFAKVINVYLDAGAKWQRSPVPQVWRQSTTSSPVAPSPPGRKPPTWKTLALDWDLSIILYIYIYIYIYVYSPQEQTRTTKKIDRDRKK